MDSFKARWTEEILRQVSKRYPKFGFKVRQI